MPLRVRAGSNAPNFVATAFNVLLPTPTQIQAFVNKQTGNKLAYVVSSLLGSPAGAALQPPPALVLKCDMCASRSDCCSQPVLQPH